MTRNCDPMEIEPVNDTKASGAGDTALLDELSSTLDALTKKPYDYALHARNIELSKSLGMHEQVDSARAMLAQSFPLPESAWLEWVEERKEIAKNSPDDPQAVAAVIELYERALNTMLCMLDQICFQC